MKVKFFYFIFQDIDKILLFYQGIIISFSYSYKIEKKFLCLYFLWKLFYYQEIFGLKIQQTSHCDTLKVKIWVRSRTDHMSFWLCISCQFFTGFNSRTGHVDSYFLQILFCRFCGGFQIPCPKCTECRFCSEDCLIDAEQSYHPFECQSNAKNIGKFFEDVLDNVSFISIVILKLNYCSKTALNLGIFVSKKFGNQKN